MARGACPASRPVDLLGVRISCPSLPSTSSAPSCCYPCCCPGPRRRPSILPSRCSSDSRAELSRRRPWCRRAATSAAASVRRAGSWSWRAAARPSLGSLYFVVSRGLVVPQLLALPWCAAAGLGPAELLVVRVPCRSSLSSPLDPSCRYLWCCSGPPRRLLVLPRCRSTESRAVLFCRRMWSRRAAAPGAAVVRRGGSRSCRAAGRPRPVSFFPFVAPGPVVSLPLALSWSDAQVLRPVSLPVILVSCRSSASSRSIVWSRYLWSRPCLTRLPLVLSHCGLLSPVPPFPVALLRFVPQHLVLPSVIA